jgi:hypothetical protein
VLTGDLPCTVAVVGQRQPTAIRFELDLRERSDRPRHDLNNLRLSVVLEGAAHAVSDDWFEDGPLRLDQALRPHRLVCCVTCLFSDYSPGGHGLMGMRCHRDAKAQYLAVRSNFPASAVGSTGCSAARPASAAKGSTLQLGARRPTINSPRTPTCQPARNTRRSSRSPCALRFSHVGFEG